MPVNVQAESVLIGISISTSFALPTNMSHVWSGQEDPFELHPIKKRAIENTDASKRSDYEDEQNYEFEKDIFENSRIGNDIDSKEETNNLASMRWTFYKAFAEIAERCIFLYTFTFN